jgi:hypothetical protein
MKRLDRVYTPTVEERVEWHLEDGTDTLYVCPDAWRCDIGSSVGKRAR